MADALRENFLGNSPSWYKLTIVGFLILNPILAIYDPFIAGWVLVLEFIFTLAMALKCYPLHPAVCSPSKRSYSDSQVLLPCSMKQRSISRSSCC